MLKTSKKFNNKGAALITILITVSFVSIIATTMLMISMNNYQMKVVNNRSKENFYETEQDINLISTKIRSEVVKSSNADASKDVLMLVGGSEMATSYTAANIAKLVYPDKTLAADNSVTVDGDKFYFSGGPIVVDTKPAGKIVTLQNVTVKQKNQDGYENSIKTNIEFYIEQGAGAGGNSGVGDCSFLMDNTITVEGGSGTRLSIYGNSIIGKYEYSPTNSYTTAPDDTTGATTTYTGCSLGGKWDCTSGSGNPAMDLSGCGYVNLLADYTVIYGDVVLRQWSVMNVIKGKLCVYGDIYVYTSNDASNTAALVCDGELFMAPDSHIYSYNTTTKSLTEITSSDKNSNVIITNGITAIEKKQVDSTRNLLKLNDADDSNDGVLPNILVQNNNVLGTKTWPTTNTDDLTEPIGWPQKTLYDKDGNALKFKNGILAYMIKAEPSERKDVYIDGEPYSVQVAQGDLNKQYANSLLFVSLEKDNTNIVNNTPHTTVIAKSSVKCTDTHNIVMTQLGQNVFNYFMDTNVTDVSDARCFPFKIMKDANVYNFVVGSFFDPNCNSLVNSIFKNSTNNGGSTKVVNSSVNYVNWTKE